MGYGTCKPSNLHGLLAAGKGPCTFQEILVVAKGTEANGVMENAGFLPGVTSLTSTAFLSAVRTDDACSIPAKTVVSHGSLALEAEVLPTAFCPLWGLQVLTIILALMEICCCPWECHFFHVPFRPYLT